jgi:hypothetical protein
MEHVIFSAFPLLSGAAGERDKDQPASNFKA